VIGQLSCEWWLFVVLGLCAGVISGMLGLGSGTVVIPALVLLCGFGQKSAQGTALAVMVPMALVGAIRYWRNPQVDLDGVVIVLIALGAVGGTLAGTELAARLPAGVLRKLFALFLVMVAVRMFTASPRLKDVYGEKNPGNQAGAEPVDRRGTNDSAPQ
jgi:uncharacterized membrane protein YfcA